jgi:hypothetical protein
MRPLPLLVLALALAGCLGENRKLTKEDAPKPGATPEPAHETPLFVFREIVPPPTYENTTRIVVGKAGVVSLEHGPVRAEEPLAADERAELDSLAERVPWGKLPTEYLPHKTTTPPKNPHTYEITFYGSGVHTVTTHDGVDDENEALARLRDKLHTIAQRLDH